MLPAGARVGWARLKRQRRARAQVVWSVLIDAVPTHGRNAQQITGAVTKQIKTYAKLLNEFTATAKLEAALSEGIASACPGWAGEGRTLRAAGRQEHEWGPPSSSHTAIAL